MNDVLQELLRRTKLNVMSFESPGKQIRQKPSDIGAGKIDLSAIKPSLQWSEQAQIAVDMIESAPQV